MIKKGIYCLEDLFTNKRECKVKSFKLLAILMIAVFTISYLPLSVTANESEVSAPDITADGAILLNLNTDSIVYEKNSNSKLYPAAAAKLMCAIVVCDNVKDLNETVIVPEGIIKGNIGNNISIKTGEIFTVEQLLGAILVGGANDAANVLACYVAGSIEEFAVLMNEKAKTLGATNTNFTNPSGIHNKNMYTTAYDMALIAKYACMNSKLLEIASLESYVIPATNLNKQRTIYNKNLMMSPNSNYYYKNAKGLSSGSTEQAGYMLITTVTEKTIPLLCVVLSSEKTKDGVIHSYKDTSLLFDWAYNSYEYKTILNPWDISYEMPVRLSAQTDYVLLYPESEIEILLPIGVDVNKDIKKVFNFESETLDAPIKKDTVVGEVCFMYNGKVVGLSKLLTASSVERSNTLYYIDVIDKIINTTWFKTSFVAFIIYSLIYITISIFWNKTHKKRRRNTTNLTK